MNEEELTVNPLDDAPADAMEDIFTLPEEIASDERILRWYEEMVTRLRREAQGVPMKTAQYTLMERIAFFYANMRYQEFHNENMTTREKMQNIQAWQSMLEMFNRMLEKHNDKLVREMLIKVQQILKDSLPIVGDATDRTNLRRKLQEEFANIDL